jgi:acylphosphatase
MAAAQAGRRAVVSGSVQGVGFRFSAARMAHRLGLGGSAENRPDGTVVVEAFGDAASVDDFVTWLHSGPPSSVVTGVEVAEIEPRATAAFDIR